MAISKGTQKKPGCDLYEDLIVPYLGAGGCCSDLCVSCRHHVPNMFPTLLFIARSMKPLRLDNYIYLPNCWKNPLAIEMND